LILDILQRQHSLLPLAHVQEIAVRIRILQAANNSNKTTHLLPHS